MKKIIVALCLIVMISGACIYWHLQTTTIADVNERRDKELDTLENQPTIEQPALDIPLDTLLKLAIHTNNIKNLEELVKNHVSDIDQAGLDGKTILTYAIDYSKKLPVTDANNLITFIVRNLGADINQEDFYEEDDRSYIPLSFAIEDHANPLLIETLIKLGANVNYRSQPNNISLLEYAFDTANAPLIKLLIAHGANVHDFNNSGTSILTFSIIQANNLHNKAHSLTIIQAIINGLLESQIYVGTPNSQIINIIESATRAAKQLNMDPEIINLFEIAKMTR